MFKGEVVVVTGGSSGIGRATCDRFLKAGAKVFNLDLRPGTPSLGEEFLECDVRDPIIVRKAIAAVTEKEGRVDILFANAGVFALGDIVETSDEQFEYILDTNLKGTWHVIRACIPSMLRARRGVIIICGSDQSLVGRKKSAAYGLTKRALGQLTKSLALDFAADGIRVNCVCPAAVDTPLCRRAIADWAQKYGGEVSSLVDAEHALQPLGRMASPDDVAALVTFLASDDARNITGSLISTDGGYVAQ